MTRRDIQVSLRSALLCLVLSAATIEGARAAGLAVRAEVVGGTTLLDRSFRDYQWDTTVRPGIGAIGLIELGGLGAGARIDLVETTQSLQPIAPRVRLSRREMVLRATLIGAKDLRLFATGSYGWTRLEYAPARIDVGGETVELAPLRARSGSAGAGIEQSVGAVVFGLRAEAQFVRLATAHRRGDEEVRSEIWFTNRQVSLSLGWRLGL
ncbi:MAG: hypothetical protein IT349_14145 [Candidatus Eisenbacteria bacterium]|nr:hypothetical protein [Candidatus Eisenbacteria bacterium]MCC7143236.1 hypothetical protein [Candidatus Eisenbacteria bacterium]